MPSRIKIVFTDLDRTLLKDNGELSSPNHAALLLLEKKGIIRVLVTGRSLFSLRRAVTADFPVDYVIFSTGIGIMNWQTGELIREHHLEESTVQRVLRILKSHQADFMIQRILPDNHYFLYYHNGFSNDDFERRICLYQDYAAPLDETTAIGPASQLLAVMPSEEVHRFHALKKELNFVRVVRTTSPLDHNSVWVEIFPEEVSKGLAAAWLTEKLNLEQSQTVSIGNDYNDLEMLQWTAKSFVVGNAPGDLLRDFRVVADNNEDGFSSMIYILQQEGWIS
ncbi:MAG: HAD family phosphatase [Candidatus Cloacimonetes bacterium]|nr:HAD family phosphatase [Candidatus Cloacimonadota bacterium]